MIRVDAKTEDMTRTARGLDLTFRAAVLLVVLGGCSPGRTDAQRSDALAVEPEIERITAMERYGRKLAEGVADDWRAASSAERDVSLRILQSESGSSVPVSDLRWRVDRYVENGIAGVTPVREVVALARRKHEESVEARVLRASAAPEPRLVSNPVQVEPSPIPSPVPPPLPWYAGGTLHGAKLADWRRATPQNRLATAADIALMLYRKQHGRDPRSTDAVRPLAEQLVADIDHVAGAGELDSLTVAEVAAALQSVSRSRER